MAVMPLTLLLLLLPAIDCRLLLRSPFDLYFFYDYHGHPNSGSHNYEQARALCESMGGQLPSYHSQADIDFVLNRLISDRARGQYIWSGLYWSDTLGSQVSLAFPFLSVLASPVSGDTGLARRQ